MPFSIGQNKLVCSLEHKFASLWHVARPILARYYFMLEAGFSVRMKTLKSKSKAPVSTNPEVKAKLKAICRAMKREKFNRVILNNDNTITFVGKVAEAVSVLAKYYKVSKKHAANHILRECMNKYIKDHGLNIVRAE
jgi:hypothetical protein